MEIKNVIAKKFITYNQKNYKIGSVIPMEIKHAKSCVSNGFGEYEEKEPLSNDQFTTGPVNPNVSLIDLESMTEEFAVELNSLGVNTIEDLQNAEIETLTEVNGIGKVTAEKLKEEAGTISNE